MKFILSVDQKASMELSYTEVADFLSFFNDNRESATFYEALAEHPSSQIRAEVAAKTCLSIETLEKLAMDKSIEVVQRVASNKRAMSEFDDELLVKMIERDVSIALEIARYQLIHIQPFVQEIIADILTAHEDPLVREALQYEVE